METMGFYNSVGAHVCLETHIHACSEPGTVHVKIYEKNIIQYILKKYFIRREGILDIHFYIVTNGWTSVNI